MNNPRVAIIGAGVSGLAAAWRLRDAPIEVTVYEESKGVAGPAASRTRHGALSAMDYRSFFNLYVG